jgi:predicted SprT family Zn-dependent metalloprotease
MHTGPVPGEYTSEWKATGYSFKCKCGSTNVVWRAWESHCGGYDDVQYKCLDCNKKWWVESSDS